MLSNIITLVSVAFGLLALALAIWQNLITRHALRAQSFLSLHELELQSRYFDGMEAIYALTDYRSFEAFVAGESFEHQQAIYHVVSFLDFVAILIEDNYLSQQNAWDIYFWAYRVCGQKLLTWWLEGQRKEQRMLFSGFERMCSIIAQVSAADIERFDRRRYKRVLGRRLYKRYRGHATRLQPGV